MKTVALIAAAGLTTVASAQNVDSLVISLTWDKTTIAIGETATATITSTHVGPAGSYLTVFAANLHASAEVVSVDYIAPVAWNQALSGLSGQGVADGASIMGLNAGQNSLLGTIDSSNPLLVTTFTVTGTAEGVLTYTAEASVPPNGAWAIIGQGNPIVPEFPAVWFGTDVLDSQALTVVPAPSAMALLGLGGLVAGRRRR